jgi:hypothetical protein
MVVAKALTPDACLSHGAVNIALMNSPKQGEILGKLTCPREL